MILRVVLTLLQHIILDLVKSHEVPMDPLLELVQVHLFLRCVSWLGVMYKLAEGAIDPTRWG